MERETKRGAASEKAIVLGHPSYVWRFGQERRLAFIRRHVPLEGKRILDVGCGLGMYVRALRRFSEEVYGVDIDFDKVVEAAQALPHLLVAPAESLPFAEGSFDVVLLHEVLEHVDDDGEAVREAYRVTARGGEVVVFAPNRLYPFETHGFYWRGRYRFGNIPLVNYLPDRWRNRLCPHVRVYTAKGLRALFRGLNVELVVHTRIYPGYDNIARRRPWLARLLRKLTYSLEGTPLEAFGLSHFLVVRKR